MLWIQNRFAVNFRINNTHSIGYLLPTVYYHL
jgi:hypothetical protein